METLVGNPNSNEETNNNEDAELATEVQKVIVRVNNFVQHIDEPEYLVDLMPEQLIQRYGRERLEETARRILQEGVSEELSEKLTALLHTLAERHFGSLGRELFSFIKVQVRYRIDHKASTTFCFRRPVDQNVIEMPASSEPVMVERLVEKILEDSVGDSGFDVYMNESNRLYEEDAPMSVHPETRWLSLEEFIKTYVQKPRGGS